MVGRRVQGPVDKTWLARWWYLIRLLSVFSKTNTIMPPPSPVLCLFGTGIQGWMHVGEQQRSFRSRGRSWDFRLSLFCSISGADRMAQGLGLLWSTSEFPKKSVAHGPIGISCSMLRNSDEHLRQRPERPAWALVGLILWQRVRLCGRSQRPGFWHAQSPGECGRPSCNVATKHGPRCNQTVFVGMCSINCSKPLFPGS